MKYVMYVTERFILNRLDLLSSLGYNTTTKQTKGKEMKKFILVKNSDGERGQNGKKKIYEIVQEGTRVVMMWGKAEELSKQQNVKYFQTETQAFWFAREKNWEKQGKGYELIASL
jgi:predicted DNA-binding WGR domain protein